MLYWIVGINSVAVLAYMLTQLHEPEQEGVNICAELLQQVAEIPGVDGANLVSPGDLETVPAAIQASGLREQVSEVSEKHETT